MTISAAQALSPAIVLTNDDGLDPSHALVLPLAKALCASGQRVVVLAPGSDNSACGQRITLGKDLSLERHVAHEATYDGRGHLSVFSLRHGTPADCMIVATEPRTGLLARMGLSPRLCVSGVNMGQNLGNDVLYSGTFAAARQAAMYGIPALAASVDLFRREEGSAAHERACADAVRAAADVAIAALAALDETPPSPGRARLVPADAGKGGENAVREMFTRGDVVLNLNAPLSWGGEYETTRLDAVLHRGPVNVERVPEDGKPFEFRIGKREGYFSEFMLAPGSDTAAVTEHASVSVSPVSTWPVPHPLAVPPKVLDGVIRQGLMRWLSVGERVGAVEKT